MNNPHTKKWKEVTLETISTIEMGQSPSSSTYNNQGVGLPFFQGKAEFGKIHPTATKWCSSPNKVANIGDILLSIRAPVGPINIADQNCAIGRGLAAIQAKPGIEIGYIAHFLRGSEKKLASMATGSTFPAVTGKVVREFPILLPPANEQRRIADKLDRVLARVDAANEHLSRVAPLIKRFRQSVLAAATSGRLTEDWRKNKLQEWKFERADAICSKVQSGGTPKAGFSPQGIPFLKVYNIVNQRIDFDYKPQFVAQEVHEGELKKSITLPDDVLMNIVGPPLGKVAIVSSTSPSWNINQAITLFRPSERILSKWIYIVLCEGAPIRSVLKSTKGSVGQVNISLSQCRAFSIPVPSIEEQSEVVRRVEKLFAFADRLEERLSQAQAAVQKLTPALLAKAFRGELVPQDPNDEPASELLKRLQESRTESAKPSRARKPRTRKSP